MKKINFFIFALILAGCSAEPKTDLQLHLNAEVDDDNAAQMEDEVRALVRLSAAKQVWQDSFNVSFASSEDTEDDVLHFSISPELDDEHVERFKSILEVVEQHESRHPFHGLTIEIPPMEFDETNEEAGSYPLELNYGSGNWVYQVMDRPGPDTYGMPSKVVYPYLIYSLKNDLPNTASQLAIIDSRGQKVTESQTDVGSVVLSIVASLPPSATRFKVLKDEKALESWDELQESYPAFVADNQLYFKLEKMNFDAGFSSFSDYDIEKVLDSNLEAVLENPIALHVVVAPVLSATLKSYGFEQNED